MSVMIELPKKKTAAKERFEDYSHLWFGPPKIGKSSIAAEFPNALFLATEPGHDGLSIYKIDIEEWDDFDKILAKLQDGNHNFQNVVVDTVDNAFQLCRTAVVTEKKIEHVSDAGWGKGYDLTDNKFQTTFNAFARLPLGLIFITHLNYDEIKKPSGDSYTLAHTTMDKRCRKYITGLVGLIWFFTKEGKKRIVYTQPDTNIEAGSRVVLPEKIELGNNPQQGYRNILSAFYGRNSDKNLAKNNLIDSVLEAESILAKEKIDGFDTEKRKINSRKKHLNTEDITKASLESLQAYGHHLATKYKNNGGNE